MFRASFWLLLLTAIATALNFWVLRLNYVTARMTSVIAGNCQGTDACWSRDIAARSGYYFRIGAAVVIEAILLFIAYKVLVAVLASRATSLQQHIDSPNTTDSASTH